jgi:phosphoglycolate phosphatase/putative hydrolase of the HAD superfamily
MLVNGPFDWSSIDLVVFDLDGTLYSQPRMRAAMLAKIAMASVGARSLELPSTLRVFRQARETLAEAGTPDFMLRQYDMTARKLGMSPDAVRALVDEWIERRPLSVIGRCVYRGVRQVFDALHAAGIRIAVLSDYPAADKLRAMGLRADLVVSAADPGVGFLKPHPAGLLRILDVTGADVGRAVMIGDRLDRDWKAAVQVGMRSLVRSRRPIPTVDTFRTYRDEPFRQLLQGRGGLSAADADVL